MYHNGVMKTKEDNCQFVCIEKSDYYRILHQVSIWAFMIAAYHTVFLNIFVQCVAILHNKMHKFGCVMI